LKPFLIIALATALCGPAGLAATAPVETGGAAACAISGWSNDTDSTGLNVRAAPRKDAPVIGRIPPPHAQADDSFAAEFDIVGSRDGWLLIRRARFADTGDGKGEHIVFAGTGWVFADKVRFLINNASLRSGPNAGAAIVARLSARGGASGPDSAIIDHVHGCNGAFADVTLHMAQRPPVRGWATGLCSNQATTCP
jgi:hypothetical protein